MKKSKILLPILTLSGLATVATPLLTLTSCNNSKCYITFEDGDNGKIVTDNRIKVKAGTKWSDFEKPYVFANQGFAVDHWEADGVKLTEDFIINNNFTAKPIYKKIQAEDVHTEEVDAKSQYSSSNLLLPKNYLVGGSITMSSFHNYDVYDEYTFTIKDIATLITELSLPKCIKYFYINRVNYASFLITNLKSELGVLSCKYGDVEIKDSLTYTGWNGVSNAFITFPEIYTKGKLEITIKVNRPDTKCVPTFELEESEL